MKGIIKAYSGSIKTRNERKAIIEFYSIQHHAQAGKLLGRDVVWKGKKPVTGKIVAKHGLKGRVVARFARALPPQALRQEIELK